MDSTHGAYLWTKWNRIAVAVRTFLNNPQILILPLHDLFEIAEILTQIVHLPIVEFDRVDRALFDIEARPDIDEDGGARGQLAGHVEGLR